MSKATNKPLSASELATIITGAIVDKFVSIGLVTVNTHPATVPPHTQTQRPAPVTHKTAPAKADSINDNRITPDMEYVTKESHPDVPRRDRKAFNQALFAVKRAAQASTSASAPFVTYAPVALTSASKPAPVTHTSTARVRPASVSSDVPTVVVSEKHRTRLPKVLFDAGDGNTFGEIILLLPGGAEESANVDAEGRSRVPSAWLGEAGQTIAFITTDYGVYQCTVTGQAQPTRTVTQTPAARATVVRPRAEVTRALEEAFAAAPRAPQIAQAEVNKPKRPTPPKCQTCNRVFVKAGQAQCAKCSGVVGGGTREEARGTRVTPRLVSMPGKLSAARTRAVGQVAALTSARNESTGEIGSTIDLGRIVSRVIKGGGLR